MKRRDFIKSVGCGAMGSTTLINTLANLGIMNGAMANTTFDSGAEDYKAIVCVLLSGGLDSYNMLIPGGIDSGGDNGFNEYKALRTDLAIQNLEDVNLFTNPLHVGIRGFNNAYNSFGVHTQMPEMKTLFDAGNLAYMSNIGTLVEPLMSVADYQNSAKKKPLGFTLIQTNKCNGKLQCRKAVMHLA